ncbi:MAG: preprotein translocase subunit YajC, partial [Hyphomonadaceae bacterium]|nr:preprotein translocase subunit YajC [Hyphomonadaceae bacterium]
MLNLIMQNASGGGGGGVMVQILPLVVIFAIFWFLLIRPQQQRMKKHRKMLAEIKRGDVVVTNGGLVGKVTKATEDELTLEIGKGVKVKAVRSMMADVRT